MAAGSVLRDSLGENHRISTYGYSSAGTFIPSFLRLSNKYAEVRSAINTSENLSINTYPPLGKPFIQNGDEAFHLVAVDVDDANDIAHSWLDTREVTQYSYGADTYNDLHLPKYLQFGGSGTKRGFQLPKLENSLLFNKVLSKEERQTVEGYLSHRWKQMLNLDPSHPYFGSPPAWSPSDEDSLEAWFDANDSSTINKNFVKKWKDRANENEFSQMELLHRPAIIENAINGLPAVDFDGEKDFLSIESETGTKQKPRPDYSGSIHYRLSAGKPKPRGK